MVISHSYVSLPEGIQKQQIDRDEASPGFDKNFKYPWIDFDKFSWLNFHTSFSPLKRVCPWCFQRSSGTHSPASHGTHNVPCRLNPQNWTCIKLWNPIIWFGYIVVVNPLFLKHNHFLKCYVREDAVLEDLNLFGWATFTLGNFTLTVWYWKWSHLVWWFTYQKTSKNYITKEYVIHIPFISSSMAKSPCLILKSTKKTRSIISYDIPIISPWYLILWHQPYLKLSWDMN